MNELGANGITYISQDNNRQQCRFLYGNIIQKPCYILKGRGLDKGMLRGKGNSDKTNDQRDDNEDCEQESGSKGRGSHKKTRGIINPILSVIISISLVILVVNARRSKKIMVCNVQFFQHLGDH